MKNNYLQQEAGKMTVIGILGIQGAIEEHIRLIEKIPNTKTILVKTLEELEQIDGLILPGGESTAIARVLRDFEMIVPLQEKIVNGLPTWGTCAGMILLAKEISNGDPTILGTMDMTVKRNAYGKQLDSFVTNEIIPAISSEPIPLVFIRAPYVEKVSDKVEVLHKVDGEIIACREKNMLATAFHPELTNNTAFHQYFINMVQEAKAY